MRASKCPAPAACVLVPTRVPRPSGALAPQKGPAPVWRSRPKVSCARLVRLRPSKGAATAWCARASKGSCDYSLRGNTFSGYKFDNKLPPAQSPKMMIVRERPHSRTELPALRIPFGDPGLPRTECRAHPVLFVSQAFHVPCCAHESPSSTKVKETGADEERGRGSEADGRKVECGRKGERIRTEKIGFLGRKICK